MTGQEKDVTEEWKEPQPLELVLANAPLPSTLKPEEAEEYKKCDAIVQKGWDGVLEVGRALITIRDKRLYRDHYHSFEDYCRERCHHSRTHMDRWIMAAEVDAELTPIGVKLEKESQLRELAGLNHEQIQAAGKKIKELTGDKGITAKVIREAAAEFKPKKARKKKGRKKSDTITIAVKPLLQLLGEAEAAAEKNDINAVKQVLAKFRKRLSGA